MVELKLFKHAKSKVSGYKVSGSCTELAEKVERVDRDEFDDT